MTLIDDLERLARAATPGPWKLDKSRRVLGPAFDGSYRSICDQVRGGSPEAADANAALIAALSPERIIAILDVIEAAQEMRHYDRSNMTKVWEAEEAFDAALSKLESLK